MVAKGLNPDDGGTEIAVRETANGDAVFAAGSITFPAALSVDEATATVTRTVLDRFLGE